jgi:hypothetical protein
MQFRLGYRVDRGNDLENEEYAEDEITSMRHHSIEVTKWSHDQAEGRGWVLVPDEEQALWLLRKYAYTSARIEYCRYFRINSIHVIADPDSDPAEVSAAVARLQEQTKLEVLVEA